MQPEDEQALMYRYENPLTDYSPQTEVFGPAQFERPFPPSVFNENEEIELTSQLLDVHNEQELDHFLGDLISKAGAAIGKFVKSPAGKAIGSVLKGVAKFGLPIAAGTVGTIFGGPVGGMVGSGLASTVTNALGLELEGLSPEDREFEAARQFVNFAGEAVKNMLEAKPNADQSMVARAAAAEAAHFYAPGLLNSGALNRTGAKAKITAAANGTWLRRGTSIVLYGT